jgi:hypothetical protein
VGAATGVTLDVSEGGAKYTVKAQIVDQSAANLTWKALLHPHAEYGGNVTLTATCSGCARGNTTATLVDLTYGDVWFCSGQSAPLVTPRIGPADLLPPPPPARPAPCPRR